MAGKQRTQCEFSPTYQEARRKFLEAAQAAGADVETIVSTHLGPDGEELAIDVASLGEPQTEKVFFLCSGTHGVEGFAGSAIQLGLQKRRAQESSAGTETRIVLIHALNPYGFACLRRFNEQNVDLNRNFAKKGAEAPVNKGYLALADAIAPASLSAISDFRALVRALWYAVRNGWSAAKQVITGGQFSDPRGLFYGGQKPSWSAQALNDILSRYGRDAKEVVFLDIHTGLGAFSSSEIILNSIKDSPEWQRAVEIWPGWVKSTKAAESISADLHGTLKLAVPMALPDAKVTAASIEFGTYSAIRVLRALRAENWLHHFGDPDDPRAKRIKADVLEAFNPDDAGWRDAICRQGLDAADRVLIWLAAR